MHYTTTPTPPRPLSAVFAGARPGSDARWRGVPRNTRTIDAAERLERQRKTRNKGRRL